MSKATILPPFRSTFAGFSSPVTRSGYVGPAFSFANNVRQILAEAWPKANSKPVFPGHLNMSARSRVAIVPMRKAPPVRLNSRPDEAGKGLFHNNYPGKRRYSHVRSGVIRPAFPHFAQTKQSS
jgi:hypothetical protein